MNFPTAISFHGLSRSDAVEAAIQRWVTRVEQLHDRVIRCNVTVDLPHRHHRRGGNFTIHVHLEIAGDNIVTCRAQHEDVYVAIADAFRATRRQLIDEREVRREVRVPLATRHVTG